MHIVISVPLDPGLAGLLGKKGSENGIAFYNGSFQDTTIVALQPTNVEDKFYSMPESMLVSDAVLLSTSALDRKFGEALVAASQSGKKVLFTDENDIAGMAASAGMADFEVVSRDSVLPKALALRTRSEVGSPIIYIDKSFTVNGVGTVVLGIVRSGVLKVHDRLFCADGAEAVVRSIQSQDRDFPSAGPGTRVGIALKGVQSSSISKGDVLSTERIKPAGEIECAISASGIAKEEIKEGKVYSIVANFFHTSAKVISIKGETIAMRLDRPMQRIPGDRALLFRDAPPRVFASLSL
jgi:selenocysteine-specific translation elongation factor